MAIPSIERLAKYDCCPTCGAGISSVSLNSRYSNGQWNEVILFECGFVVRWEPNHKKERIGELCGTTKPEIMVGATYVDHRGDVDELAVIVAISRVHNHYESEDIVLRYGSGDCRIVSKWQFHCMSYRQGGAAAWRFEFKK